MADYRGNFERVYPLLSISSNEAAVEEIKMDSIYQWDGRERKAFERASKPEVCHAIAENS
jgi:hypothetical protein